MNALILLLGWSILLVNLICEVFELLRNVSIIIVIVGFMPFLLFGIIIIIIHFFNVLIDIEFHFLFSFVHLLLHLLIGFSRILISLLHIVGNIHVLKVLIEVIVLVEVLVLEGKWGTIGVMGKEHSVMLTLSLLLLVTQVRRPHILVSHLVFEKLISGSVIVEIEVVLRIHGP